MNKKIRMVLIVGIVVLLFMSMLIVYIAHKALENGQVDSDSTTVSQTTTSMGSDFDQNQSTQGNSSSQQTSSNSSITGSASVSSKDYSNIVETISEAQAKEILDKKLSELSESTGHNYKSEFKEIIKITNGTLVDNYYLFSVKFDYKDDLFVHLADYIVSTDGYLVDEYSSQQQDII